MTTEELFARTFVEGDRVRFHITDEIQGTGTVCGLGIDYLIKQYIVRLDQTFPDYPWTCCLVQNTLMEKIEDDEPTSYLPGSRHLSFFDETPNLHSEPEFACCKYGACPSPESVALSDKVAEVIATELRSRSQKNPPYDETCHQCMNENLKGIHTCDKRRTRTR